MQFVLLPNNPESETLLTAENSLKRGNCAWLFKNSNFILRRCFSLLFQPHHDKGNEYKKGPSRSGVESLQSLTSDLLVCPTDRQPPCWPGRWANAFFWVSANFNLPRCASQGESSEMTPDVRRRRASERIGMWVKDTKGSVTPRCVEKKNKNWGCYFKRFHLSTQDASVYSLPLRVVPDWRMKGLRGRSNRGRLGELSAHLCVCVCVFRQEVCARRRSEGGIFLLSGLVADRWESPRGRDSSLRWYGCIIRHLQRPSFRQRPTNAQRRKHLDVRETAFRKKGAGEKTELRSCKNDQSVLLM